MFRSIFAAVILAASFAPHASAAELAGTWLVEDRTAVVEIYSCDQNKETRRARVSMGELCQTAGARSAKSRNHWCGKVIEVTRQGVREARNSGIDPRSYENLPILCVDKRRRAGELYSVKGQGLLGNHHRIQVKGYGPQGQDAMRFNFCIWAGCKEQLWQRKSASNN